MHKVLVIKDPFELVECSFGALSFWGSTLSEQPAAGAERKRQQYGKREREMVSETGSGGKAGSNWARL